MFEVRCIVADKRLPNVLRALKDLTLEPPVTLAVDEQEPAETPKGPAAQLPTNANAASAKVFEYVKKYAPGDTILRKDVIAHLGLTAAVVSYALGQLIKAKMLKRKGYGKYERIGE